MTPKERRVDRFGTSQRWDWEKPQNNERPWQPAKIQKQGGPTLKEKIKKVLAEFQKRRIARMHPEERELYFTFIRSKERYANLQRTVGEIKAGYAQEIAGLRRKKQEKGPEYSELDKEGEEHSLRQWKAWLEKHEEALPQAKQDYETALNLWKGRRLLRKTRD